MMNPVQTQSNFGVPNLQNITLRKLGTAILITFLLILPVFSTVFIFSPYNNNKETNNEISEDTKSTISDLNPISSISDSQNENQPSKQESHESNIKDNTGEEKISEPIIHFEYPVYDLITTGLIQISIEVPAKLAKGRILIWTIDQNMERDQVISEIDSVPSQNFYVELEKDLYQIEVIYDTTQFSETIYLLPGKEYNLQFNFNEITFDIYDFNEVASSLEEVSIIDHVGIPIWGPAIISENYDITLIVESGLYSLVRETGLKETIDASENIIYPVRVEAFRQASALQLNQGASFGKLTVNTSTVDDMPLQSVTTKWYNSSDYSQTGSGSSNSTGFTTFSLAPGLYDVQTYFSVAGFSTWNYSVLVTGGFENIVQVGLSHLHIYTNGNKVVSIYNGSDNSLILSQWSGSDGIGDWFVPGNQNYTVNNDGFWSYNHIVGIKERLVIGTRLNQAPTFTSVSSDGRITANQSTMVYIRARDLNFDYPLQFYISQNMGTVSISPGFWVSDETWGINVEFTAPITDDFYQFDIGVQDIDGLFTNQTLYLSNRRSDVTLRNVVADFQPVNLVNGLYSVLPDVNYVAWSGSDGNNTYFNAQGVLDGLYRIKWNADNIFTTKILKIDANVGSYFFQYNWTQITFNTTAEWGNPIGIQLKIYNATANLVSTFATKSTSSSGFGTATISPYGNYSIEARGSNSLWQHEISVAGGILYKYNFSFAGIAVYTVGLVNRVVTLYNGTSMSQIVNVWSGSDGIMLFRVAEYSNYTVNISAESLWITNITVSAGTAVAVGAFTNTAPSISTINTNPGNVRINANENVTVLVTASDIDPVDFLTYTWSANVGTFIGSGASVLYVAPAVTREYKIEVLVEDQFGGNDTTYLYVSNRYSTINVQINNTNGGFNDVVTITRTRDNFNFLSTWVGSDGFYSFSGVPDEEYLVSTKMNGRGFFEYLIANASTYNYNFRYGDFVFNATAGNSEGIQTSIRIRDNNTNTQYSSISTNSVTGLSSLTSVTPGTYNLEAISSNSIWKYQVTITENELANIDFQFAEILVNTTQAYGRPFNGVHTVYNWSSSVTSVWSGSDGIQSFYLNPTNSNYSVQNILDNTFRIDNIILSENELFLANLGFAALVTYSNDGVNPISQTVYVYNATTNVLIRSRNTGVDGFDIFNLRPGVYDVRIGASEWYNNVELLPSERYSVGTQLNSAPVIVDVFSNPARVNPNEQTTVTVQITDIDYDYPSLFLTVTPNVGSITNLMPFHGFVSTNVFYITFVYTAPSTLQLYQLDITVSDGVDTDSELFFVSNSLNTVNLHSNKGIAKPESTTVYLYEYQTNDLVWSGNTGTGGYIQTQILDGWYNFEFREVNSIWFRNVFISNNQILNLTASFGEVTVFVSGVGGVPINAVVTVTNSTTSSNVRSQWSGSDGEITFILAPGNYTIEVAQSTSVFFNLRIVGGAEIFVGSEIPELTTQPSDISYIFGDTGYSITWGFTDANPHMYNLTQDGVTVDSGIWDGFGISINVDGLQVGSYVYRLRVNDTYGYYNFDDVIVTVTSVIDPPGVSAPDDITQTVEDSINIAWDVNGTLEDRYEIHEDGLLVGFGSWTNGSIIAYAGGSKLPGVYTYVITVNNTLGMFVQDTLIVTVSVPALPAIDGSGDNSIYEIYDFNIEWNVTGPYPSTYEVYLDSVLIDSNTWLNGDSIGLTNGPFAPGTYNYTIIVYDTYGGFSTNTIFITSTYLPPPTLTSPADVSALTTDTVSFDWTLNGELGTGFELYLNGVMTSSGSWTDGLVTNVSLGSNPAVGVYNYTIVIWNQKGDTISDTVIVTISAPPVPATPLTFDSIPVDLVIGPDSAMNEFEWSLVGTSPASYEILVNGTLESSGDITGTLTVTFSFATLKNTPGTYMIVINVDQGSLGVISDTVYLTVLAPSAENSESSDSPFSSLILILSILGLMSFGYRNVSLSRRSI